MTRHDKKLFIKNTQENIIHTYRRVFEDEMGQYTEINGMLSREELSDTLKKRIVDMLF